MTHIDNFTNDIPNTSIYFQPGMNYHEMIEDVTGAAEDRNVSFFLIKHEIISSNCENVIIYVSDADTTEWLINEKAITEGSHKSLFLGNITVLFKEYRSIEGVELEKNNQYYVIGSHDDVQAFKMDLINKYAGNHPEFPDSNEDTYFSLLGLWSIIFLLILLLTVFYIQVKRREIFLRIIYGENRLLIIAREAAIDLLVILISAVCIPFLLVENTESYFCSAVFYGGTAVYAFANTVLYFTLIRFEARKVYGNRQVSGATMPFMYALKVISMVLAALALTSNFILIQQSISYLSQEEFFQEHGDYYYTNIAYIPNVDASGQISSTIEDNARIKEFFYWDNFDAFQPILLAEFGQMKNIDIVYANSNAIDYLQEIIPNLQENNLQEDCFYIIPEKLSSNAGILQSLDLRLQNYFSEDILMNRRVIYYSGKPDVINIDELSATISKYSRAPIIILDNRTDQVATESIEGNPFFVTIDQAVMYKMNESAYDNFITAHDLEAEIHGKSNVYDVYLQGKLLMQRILKMAIVLGGFFVALELAILLTITKMEFRIHAYEISLQKLLGYTKHERFSRLFLLSACATIISGVAFFIIDMVYKLYPVWQGMLVILGVFLVEILIMNWEINKLEKRSIPLVLKGEFK